MILTRFTIENFKGIKGPVQIDFKPITLLFGPNSAGKSTIVQALHYALEVFDRKNFDPGKTAIGGLSLDLGGFESLVTNHDLSNNIKLKFELDLEREDLPVYFDLYEGFGQYHFMDESPTWKIPARAKSAWIEVALGWSHQLNYPIAKSYKIGVNGYELAEIKTTDDGKQVFLSDFNPLHPIFLEGVTIDQALTIFEKRFVKKENLDPEDIDKLGPMMELFFRAIKWEGGFPGLTSPIPLDIQMSAIPLWGKTLFFDEGVWVEDVDYMDQGSNIVCLSSLIVGPGELVRDELRRLLYLGPIREIPSRNYSPEKSPDPSRWASGMMGWDILFQSDEAFVEKVNRWLTQQGRLDSGYSIRLKRFREINLDDPVMLLLAQGAGLEEMEAIQTQIAAMPVKRRLTIIEEATGVELMPQDIGVGISQVLPVIVGALHIKNGIFAIEQPELHIHPALQVALGDLFISQIQEKDVMFLLETHSEHLMLRLLRRIRETGANELEPGKWPLTPDQLAVYYVEQGENGVTLTQLRVDTEGEFVDRWPKGFFGERMKELF